VEKKISEEKFKEIEKKSKELLLEFNRKLEKIKFSEGSSKVNKDRGRKEEKTTYSEDFRKIFLKNAPQKDGDSIVAEKGKWKE